MRSLCLNSLLKCIFCSVIAHRSWGARFGGDGTCAVSLLGCGSTAELRYRPTVKLTVASTQACPDTHTHTQKHIHSQHPDGQLTRLSKPLQRKLMSSAPQSSHRLLSFFTAYTLPLCMIDTICSPRHMKLHRGPGRIWRPSPFSYSAELSEYLSVRSKADKTVLFTNTVEAPDVLQLRAAGWDLTLKHGSTEQSQKRVFNDF